MRPTDATRRRVLGAALGVTAGFAGCLGDGADDPAGDDGSGDGDDDAGDDGAGDNADDGDAEYSTVEESWPQARFGPRNAGARPGETGPSSLTQRWVASLDEIVALPPIVVDDLVLAQPATFDGDVYALDAATGERRWATLLGADGNTEPVVDEGVVYLGDAAGKLNVVRTGDPPDGEAAELFNLNGEIRGAPAVRDGVCYFGAGDGGAYAYDTSEGEFVWGIDTGSPIQSPATVVDDVLYLGNDDGTLFALSTEDGDERWRRETGERIRGAPTVDDGTVYVGTGEGTILALDAADGTEQWTAAVEDSAVSEIPVVDGTAYVADNSTTLTAFDAATGEVRWHVGIDEDRITPAPVVTDDAIYHHFGTSRLLALDPASGEEVASAEIDPTFWSAPTLANGTVYVGAGDGVYAFSA